MRTQESLSVEMHKMVRLVRAPYFRFPSDLLLKSGERLPILERRHEDKAGIAPQEGFSIQFDALDPWHLWKRPPR
jgi:hypothetical protein